MTIVRVRYISTLRLKFSRKSGLISRGEFRPFFISRGGAETRRRQELCPGVVDYFCGGWGRGKLHGECVAAEAAKVVLVHLIQRLRCAPSPGIYSHHAATRLKWQGHIEKRVWPVLGGL
jgi:hypothetical protein